MIREPKTHPERPTLNRSEAADDVRALWEELRDVNRNEEAWFIIAEAFSKIRAEFPNLVDIPDEDDDLIADCCGCTGDCDICAYRGDGE